MFGYARNLLKPNYGDGMIVMCLIAIGARFWWSSYRETNCRILSHAKDHSYRYSIPSSISKNYFSRRSIVGNVGGCSGWYESSAGSSKRPTRSNGCVQSGGLLLHGWRAKNACRNDIISDQIKPSGGSRDDSWDHKRWAYVTSDVGQHQSGGSI